VRVPQDLARRRQETLLRVLREAGDRPLGLPELRERGVTNPAAVIYELEIAGYQIDRVHRQGRLVGVRLGQAAEPYAEAARGRRTRL
jgi:biotin operon repressor